MASAQQPDRFTGIRLRKNTYEVYVHAAGRRWSKTFPQATPIATMQRWRQNARHEAEYRRRFEPQSTVRAKSLAGWCYVYFARAGDLVKIGRAKNVDERLRNMQCGQHLSLDLLAAVPAHAALEAAIQEEFQRDHERGEWFRLSPRLMRFIELVRDGINPLALLFEPGLLENLRGHNERVPRIVRTVLDYAAERERLRSFQHD